MSGGAPPPLTADSLHTLRFLKLKKKVSILQNKYYKCNNAIEDEDGWPKRVG